MFLGATVADAAARPLHWVYNQKKLLTYIKGRKDFTFLTKNKSPFYNIKTGKVSGYNDVGQVMFKTLVEGHKNIEERFKKNITKNFGPGSKYWENLNLRAKYRKVKDWRGIIKGPWIHQNIIETVKNIKAKKKLMENKKIEIIWDSAVDEVIGDGEPKNVTGIKVKNLKTNNVEEMKIDGLFIAIGHDPATALFKEQLDMDKEGYLITKPDSTETNIPGVYAAGDVKDKTFRQAVTAAGMGCMAALEAEKHLSH